MLTGVHVFRELSQRTKVVTAVAPTWAALVAFFTRVGSISSVCCRRWPIPYEQAEMKLTSSYHIYNHTKWPSAYGCIDIQCHHEFQMDHIMFNIHTNIFLQAIHEVANKMTELAEIGGSSYSPLVGGQTEPVQWTGLVQHWPSLIPWVPGDYGFHWQRVWAVNM